jgi:hypothetical protein
MIRFPVVFRRALWPIAALLLGACANSASTFVAAPPQPEKGSVVYIYRPFSSANFMFSPKVVIDQNEKFSLGNGHYHYVYLQAGEHSAGLNATDQYTTEAAIVLDIEPGQSYYLRVNTALKFETDGMNARKFWIEVVEENAALSEIRKTKHVGPGPEQSTAGQADEPGNEAGFSVEKTEDPFAGKYE